MEGMQAKKLTVRKVLVAGYVDFLFQLGCLGEITGETLQFDQGRLREARPGKNQEDES